MLSGVEKGWDRFFAGCPEVREGAGGFALCWQRDGAGSGLEGYEAGWRERELPNLITDFWWWISFVIFSVGF